METECDDLFMTRARFYEVFDELCRAGRGICDTKGKEYSNEGNNYNALNNFKVVAELVGITPMQVALVYMLKHILALCTIAGQGGKTSSTESVESRVTDVMVYAALTAAILDAESHAKAIKFDRELPF